MKDTYEINKTVSGNNGRVDMTGRVVIKNITFVFSLHPTKVQGYLFRGHMSIISPQDGKVLQVVGEKRKQLMKKLPEYKQKLAEKGRRVRELMAADDFYIATDSQEEIRVIVERKANEMYGYYGEEIRAASGRPMDKHISAEQAFQAEGENFIASISGRTENKRANENLVLLEKMCYQLSEKAMCDITVDDIHRFARNLTGNNETRKRKLSLLRRFWDHCFSKRLIDGRNPVEQYIKENPGIRNRQSRKRTNSEKLPGRLEKKQEQKLLQFVREHIEEGLSLSVLLLNGGGIPPSAQTSLTWGDVTINNDDPSDVRVHVKRLNSTWATQDYTRPLFRAEGELIYEKYRLLSNEGQISIDDIPVVSSNDNTSKRVSTAEITAYIRNALLHAGVKNSILAPSKNQDKSVGMGTQFLQKNYLAKLLECGLETDKGLLDFLCLKKIASVTADHYRSFTSPEGQLYIRCVLDRYVAEDGQKETKPTQIPTKRKNGSRRIRMESSGTPRCNMMEVDISLKKGQLYTLDSSKGIEGELFVLPVNKDESEVTPQRIIEVY